jgi:DNA-binding XRE family transcriptional regulator
MKAGATESAKERATLIRQAREHREPLAWSQSKLAEEVNVTRETVYQWESAGVEEIEFVTCVRVARELGLELSDLLTEAQRKDMINLESTPGLSPQARRIARIWDTLPQALRTWIWNSIEAYQGLEKASPFVAQAITAEPHSETGQFEKFTPHNKTKRTKE